MKKLALFIVLFLLVVSAAYYLYVRAPTEYAGPVSELVALAPHAAEWIIFVDLTAWRRSRLGFAFPFSLNANLHGKPHRLGLLLDGLLALARTAIQAPNIRKRFSAREIEHLAVTLAGMWN